MRKCNECEFLKEITEVKNRKVCMMPVDEMETNCLLRHILWTLGLNRELAKKYERFIDKSMKEIDEGENWKNQER